MMAQLSAAANALETIFKYNNFKSNLFIQIGITSVNVLKSQGWNQQLHLELLLPTFWKN